MPQDILTLLVFSENNQNSLSVAFNGNSSNTISMLQLQWIKTQKLKLQRCHIIMYLLFNKDNDVLLTIFSAVSKT
jgi:hypothetical protein